MQLVHCLCYVVIRLRGQQLSRVGKQLVRANVEDRELVVAVMLKLLLFRIYWHYEILVNSVGGHILY